METRFPSTREAALNRLKGFNAALPRYDKERNFVVPGHENVSRLSPAVRHRLISEQEVADDALNTYTFPQVEKFVQEVYWRRYWKGWLAMRPFVWDQYRSDLKQISYCEEAEALMRGEGKVEIMNYFAKELVKTGYLHNHARMWFAAYWIHSLGLPWQLGADFFYRHLLDADPASNTLSWRWVAGLQTKGKTYLARRTNILKFMHPDLMTGREGGLDTLDGVLENVPSEHEFESVNGGWLEPSFPPINVDATLPIGMWIHEEHLSADLSFKEKFTPTHFLVSLDQKTEKEVSYSPVKQDWMQDAVMSTYERLKNEHESVGLIKTRSIGHDLVSWASQLGLTQLIACRPEVGYLHDQLPETLRILKEHGIQLHLLELEEDVSLRPLAKGGFFGFWKKMKKRL